MENKRCDICGAIGKSKSLVACYRCEQACEHVYCMRTNLRFVPDIWYCEACRLQKESNLKARSDPVKIRSPLQKSPVPRNGNLKPVESGRVKYIPAEEAVMLSSGTKKKTVISSSSQSSPSDGKTSISKRTLPVSTSLSKCFVQKQDATPKKRAVRTKPLCGDRMPNVKPSLGEKLDLYKVEGREASAEVHERASYASSTPIESLNIRNSGGASDVDQQSQIILDSGTSLTDSQHQKSVQEKDLVLFSPRFEEDHENLPALDCTWKGSFEIVNMSSCSQFYDGFRAHPPGKVSLKAYEFSKKIPGILQFKLQNHSDVWAEVFDSSSPTGSDIALYFFPGDFERSIKMYNSLYMHLEMHDFAMRSCLEGVELLIFTSKQLPLDSRINMESYLWGVFHCVEGNTNALNPADVLLTSSMLLSPGDLRSRVWDDSEMKASGKGVQIQNRYEMAKAAKTDSLTSQDLRKSSGGGGKGVKIQNRHEMAKAAKTDSSTSQDLRKSSGGGSRSMNECLQFLPLDVKKEKEAPEPESDKLGIKHEWFGSRKSVKNKPASSSYEASMAMYGDCSEPSLSRSQYMKDGERWLRDNLREKLEGDRWYDDVKPTL